MSGHGRVRRGKGAASTVLAHRAAKTDRPRYESCPDAGGCGQAQRDARFVSSASSPRAFASHEDECMVWVKPLQWRDEERLKPAAVTFDDQLAELWAAGATMSDIGLKLGGSRSLVAGRIARARARGDLRFALRPPTPKKERAPERQIVKPAVVKPVGAAAFVERKGKPLVTLKPGQCHYPLNDPERGGKFLFCGEPIAKSGANYCSRHTAISVRVSVSGQPL